MIVDFSPFSSWIGERWEFAGIIGKVFLLGQVGQTVELD
jgi:hypothetical protein